MTNFKFPCLAVLLSSLLFLVGCSDSSDSRANNLKYQADITWTEFGIPHIAAEDWGSLGFGTGYAFARDNYCTMMRVFLVARGETARYLGEDGDVELDLVWKLINSEDRIQQMLESVSHDARELIDGYVAGFNRYLIDTGVENLPQNCRGQEWASEITSSDVMRAIHRLVLVTSGDALAPFIAAAQPPSAQVSAVSMESLLTTQEVGQRLAALDPEVIRSRLGLPDDHALGSNAYAAGGEATQSGSGVLLSNPHLAWDVPLRYTMLRQTMGDELDIMGATPFGVPIVGVGFNSEVAWAITVSTSSRFTFYELQLNPENPLQYIYDGEVLDLSPRQVTAERLLPDGTVEVVERTFYLSHYGPIVDLGSASPLLGGWPNALGTLISYRDANLENARTVDQWMQMSMAKNTSDLSESLRTLGQPFINTMAADRHGDTFFGNVSVSANVSDAQYSTCVAGPLALLLTEGGSLTLDGSNSFCEWGNDEDAPAPGIFGWSSLPKLETRDYVANANDSHWHINPRNLLEGFPLSLGSERSELSIRSRHTFDQAERRRNGTDGLGPAGFSVQSMQTLMYSASNHAATLSLAEVVSVCESESDWSKYSDYPVHVAEACSVLGAWDKSHRLDSVGAHVFWEFWQLVRDTPALWSVPFDASDPIGTPRSLNIADDAIVEAVKMSLADAVAILDDAGIPLDAPWGEVQFEEKNGVRYGIHGGDESMMFSAILSELIPEEGYSQISLGNSYIQAVGWDESDCPDAFAVLTYSQSTNPESPHFADSTDLYSRGEWIDMPYCEEAVQASMVENLTLSQ